MSKRILALQRLIAQLDVSVEEGWTSAGEVNTHYLTAGRGVPLVLVHGGGAGAIQWGPIIEPLSSQFQVIAPDVVGYGESDKPNAPYDRPYFAGWLGDFIRSLRLKRTHLLAASQAGPAAIEFMSNHLEQVDRFILADSGGFGSRPPGGVLLRMLLLYTFPSITALRWYSKYVVHNDASLGDDLAAYAVEVIRMPGGKLAFRQGRGQAVEPIPPELTRGLKQPTLVIWGQEERFFPISQLEQVRKLLNDAKVVVLPEAGHLSFLDQPVMFSKAVTAFLSEGQAGSESRG